MKKLAWHFDLHTPGYVRVNTAPAVEAAADELAAAGVEEIITFAKCHFGYAYYPTEVGTVHPRMEGDAFGDLLAACRGRGLRVLAYVSFGIDGQAVERHPEWEQVSASGRTPVEPGRFRSVCPFTGYTDELLLPQVSEIIERYRPDGFFFDTMGAMGVCHCDSCRRDFRAAAGQEIPVEAGDTRQGEYGHFRHERAFALLARIGNFIRERLPEAVVGFNQIGSLPYPENMPEGVTRLTLDFPTFGSQCIHASLNASYGATAKLPGDIMPTIFNRGWADWSLRPDHMLRQTAAAIWARGLRVYPGDRLHPQNRLHPATSHALRVLSETHAEMAAAMPPDGTPVSPDILILHSPLTTAGADMRYFACKPKERLLTVEGAHRLMLDAGCNTAVTAEYNLAHWLERAPLVVLPEIENLLPETDQLLREYVAGGGCLLVTGRLPLVGGRPLDWAGISREETPWQDHIYLPSWGDEAETLVRGDFHCVSAGEAETVCRAIPAWDARHGQPYGWKIGPAADEPSPHPAVTRAKVGKGEIWTLGVPLFSDYALNADWNQVAWWRGLLERIPVAPRARVTAPAGGIDLVVYETPASTWAILVNLNGEQLTWNGRAAARTPALPPPFEARLELAEAESESAKIFRDGRPCAARAEGGRVLVRLKMDREWTVIRVDRR